MLPTVPYSVLHFLTACYISSKIIYVFLHFFTLPVVSCTLACFPGFLGLWFLTVQECSQWFLHSPRDSTDPSSLLYSPRVPMSPRCYYSSSWLTVLIYIHHGFLCSVQFTLLSLTVSDISPKSWKGFSSIPHCSCTWFSTPPNVLHRFKQLSMLTTVHHPIQCPIWFPTLPKFPLVHHDFYGLLDFSRVWGAPPCSLRFLAMNILKISCTSQSSTRFPTPAHVLL